MVHIPKIEMLAAREIVKLIAIESILPRCHKSQKKEAKC